MSLEYDVGFDHTHGSFTPPEDRTRRQLREQKETIERLQARVETLEGAIKETISNFYTDKPPYYLVHHEVGDMLEQALAATEQEANDE